MYLPILVAGGNEGSYSPSLLQAEVLSLVSKAIQKAELDLDDEEFIVEVGWFVNNRTRAVDDLIQTVQEYFPNVHIHDYVHLEGYTYKHIFLFEDTSSHQLKYIEDVYEDKPKGVISNYSAKKKEAVEEFDDTWV